MHRQSSNVHNIFTYSKEIQNINKNKTVKRNRKNLSLERIKPSMVSFYYMYIGLETDSFHNAPFLLIHSICQIRKTTKDPFIIMFIDNQR